jgi:hypothetical protein
MIRFDQWMADKMALRQRSNVVGPDFPIEFYKGLYQDEVQRTAPKEPDQKRVRQLEARITTLERSLSNTLQAARLLQDRVHSLDRLVDKPFAKPGVTLAEAECLRAEVWAAPFEEVDDRDWDEISQTYPAKMVGTCRHKSAWLCEKIGGKVIFGRRTDRPDGGFHAALLVRIDGRDVVLDNDKTWAASEYPFREEAHPRVKSTGQPAVIAELVQRIEELERRPHLKYLGVWDSSKTYRPGDIVTVKGSLWHCDETTTMRPPGSAWTLCVKAGRDGRDLTSKDAESA